MRLIDADALRHSHCVECTYYYEDKCLEKNGGECDWDSIYHIDIAPTVDAVPVVRCKECFMRADCKAAVFYGDDGYCSIGKKAGDAE